MKTNLKEKISLAIVVILVGTIFLPIQSTTLQASILQNPSKTGTDTQYWALLVGIGKYAENPEQNRPDMILEVNDFRDLLLQSPWWSADHIKTSYCGECHEKQHHCWVPMAQQNGQHRRCCRRLPVDTWKLSSL